MDCSEVKVFGDIVVDGIRGELFENYVGKTDCDVYINVSDLRQGYAISRMVFLCHYREDVKEQGECKER